MCDQNVLHQTNFNPSIHNHKNKDEDCNKNKKQKKFIIEKELEIANNHKLEIINISPEKKFLKDSEKIDDAITLVNKKEKPTKIMFKKK